MDGLIPNFKFYSASPDSYKARSSKNFDLPAEANRADFCRECEEFERNGRIGGRAGLRGMVVNFPLERRCLANLCVGGINSVYFSVSGQFTGESRKLAILRGVHKTRSTGTPVSKPLPVSRDTAVDGWRISSY